MTEHEHASQFGRQAAAAGARAPAPNNVARWAPMATGGLLALYGLRRRSLPGLLLAIAGGAMALRSLRGQAGLGQSLGRGTRGPIQVLEAVTILRPRQEVYGFWRDFAHLPRFMRHLESVRVIDERHSHWVATGPAGRSLEWDAEIVEDRPGSLIAWRSLGQADVPNRGEVRFADAPGERGTELRVRLEYDPPAGSTGATFAKLFGHEPSLQIAEDVRRCKQLLEAGEIVTAADQSVGPGGEGRPVERYGALLTQVAEAVDSLRGGRRQPAVVGRPAGDLGSSEMHRHRRKE